MSLKDKLSTFFGGRSNQDLDLRLYPGKIREWIGEQTEELVGTRDDFLDFLKAKHGDGKIDKYYHQMVVRFRYQKGTWCKQQQDRQNQEWQWVDQVNGWSGYDRYFGGQLQSGRKVYYAGFSELILGKIDDDEMMITDGAYNCVPVAIKTNFGEGGSQELGLCHLSGEFKAKGKKLNLNGLLELLQDRSQGCVLVMCPEDRFKKPLEKILKKFKKGNDKADSIKVLIVNRGNDPTYSVAEMGVSGHGVVMSFGRMEPGAIRDGVVMSWGTVVDLIGDGDRNNRGIACIDSNTLKKWLVAANARDTIDAKGE